MSAGLSPRLQVVSAELDPDGKVLSSLRRGRTLPSHWYTDPDIFALEQKLVFARGWDFIGNLSQVAKPGDYFTCVSSGTPVVVVRDKKNILRAFINSCRHRKSAVADGSGNQPLFVCRYHSWSYDLDGSLKRAPRSKEDVDFCNSEMGLEPVSIDTLGEMIFVNLSDDALDLHASLGPIPESASNYGIPLSNARFREMRVLEASANWKILWDNNSECYHCPTIHAAWFKEADLGPDSVSSHPIGPFHFQHVMKSRPDTPDDNHFFCWPTFTLATDSASGPGFAAGTRQSRLSEAGHLGYFIWRWIPVAADSTRIELHLFTENEIEQSVVDEWYGALFQVLLEDKEICESVHQSHAFDAGSPGTLITAIDSEYQVQIWQLLLHRALTKPDCGLYAPLSPDEMPEKIHQERSLEHTD